MGPSDIVDIILSEIRIITHSNVVKCHDGEKERALPDMKTAVVSLYYSGIGQSKILCRLRIQLTTNTGIINRYCLRNNVENLPRSGAPAKLSERDSRTLLRLVKRNRKRTLSDITGFFNHARNFTVSQRTVQQILYSKGFRRHVIVKQIRIQEVKWKSHVIWCRTNRRTADQYWRRVIYSDKCKVDIGMGNKVFISGER